MSWRAITLLSFGAAAVACGDNQTFVERPYDPGTPDQNGCVPNLDSQIVANELQPRYGIPASYLVSAPSETRAVNIAGAAVGDGTLAWDWSIDYATDGAIDIQPIPLDTQWYADSFPTGEFVYPFDAAGTIEAVYSLDGENLWLHGFASTLENPGNGRTLLPYQSPVSFYRLPLEVGASWTSVGVVAAGLAGGLPYAGTDSYVMQVDARGRLDLPAFILTDALRLRSAVTIDPAVGMTRSWHSVFFIFECFGEVARAQSADNEPNADFTTAIEQRRLGM